jgi:hypothetical protein
MDTIHDSKIRRCPRLGHDITFAYCRVPGEQTPCFKILDCWWEIFDIKAFMEENYTKEVLQKISLPPKQKTTSLLEMIQEAQKRINKK